MNPVLAGPLSPELLHRMDAYWRAANYLSVGQIYLYDNPLLKKPLELTVTLAPKSIPEASATAAGSAQAAAGAHRNPVARRIAVPPAARACARA